MRSLVLGKVFGIAIELHWSFLLIIFFILVSAATESLQSMLATAMLFFFLFLSVLLHELTHSIVSIKRGIAVHKIMLLPIGGVAMAEELPEKASDEFLISVSGPLFNFLLVILVLLAVSFFSLPFPWQILSQQLDASEFDKLLFEYPLFTLLYVNLMLGTFNLLLPALPLDGGRVLRSLLSMKFGLIKATRIVTTISAAVALFLFMISFAAQNLLMTIISVFIFFGASEEARIIETKHALKGITIMQLVDKKPIIFESNTPIELIIEELLSRNKFSCLIDFGQNRYGVFDLNDLPQNLNLKSPACEYAKAVEPLDASLTADKALERFIIKGLSMLPVFESGQLVGTLSLETIERAYRISAIKETLSKTA